MYTNKKNINYCKMSLKYDSKFVAVQVYYEYQYETAIVNTIRVI